MRTAKNTLRSANVRIKRLRLMSALQQTEAHQTEAQQSGFGLEL